MKDQPKTWVIPFVAGLIFVVFVFVNLLAPNGPSEEEYAQYNSLKMESVFLENLLTEIDSMESGISNAKEQLNKMKRGKKGFQKEFETLVSNLAEKKASFNRGVMDYEQKKLFLPAELRDSLKIFQEKGSPSLLLETSNPPH